MHTHKYTAACVWMKCRCILCLWFISSERRVRDEMSPQKHFLTAGIGVSGCGSRAWAGSLHGGATHSGSLAPGVSVPSGL